VGPYRICNRCVMDTSDLWIKFDSEGNCNHCTEYIDVRMKLVQREPTDTNEVDKLFATIKQHGTGSKYDCVLGMSGGVDSSHVATLAARYGLRVLAVHLDNGWNSPIAVENINKLVSKFNFGYASHVLPWNEFKKVQVAFLKASVPEAETPTDVAIQRAIHEKANKHGIHYILSGGNLQSEGILPESWHYNARDTRYSYAILKQAGCAKKHFKPLKYGLAEEAYYKLVRRIKTVYPLNLVPYDRVAVRRELEASHDWKYYGSKHGESRFTRFVQSYYQFVKHGIDYRRATLSSEICLGQTTRERALEILKALPYDPATIDEEVRYIAKKLGLTESELVEIVKAPARWYKDFPRNEVMLGNVYNAYRYINGQVKTHF
jgi:N-acetyl sugar amidotransferase